MKEASIFDVFTGPLPAQAGGIQSVLRDTDHLLGRFGEAAWLSAEPKARLGFSLRPDADRVWAMLEGASWAVLHDLRESSPSLGCTQVVRLDRNPLGLLLIPFGVAAGLQVMGGPPAGMLILSTYALGDSAPEQTIPVGDPRIAFDWSSLA
ncbi:MAG: dTDP-4-dehydrorhamnose 3,5-epimerase family protein [Anaerolineales bacterium]